MEGIYGRKINEGLRKGTALHLYLPGPRRGVWNVDTFKAARGEVTRRTMTPDFWGYRDGSPIVNYDFDQSLAPINSYYQGSAGGAHTVRTGDTLASIASGLWGDSSLWYKLAEANGLTSNATLVEGQVLTVPVGVVRSAHNASTFAPYDPAATLGDVSPSVPAPAGRKGCGIIGQILLVVIAVAVTVALRIPVTNFFGGAVSAKAAAGATALGASASVAAAAGAAAAGTTAVIAGGAVAGAVGSIVSQAVAVATGIQDKFSWNQVALAAVGGGVGASGLGNGLGRVGSAITQNVVTQGIGVALGFQDNFSWAGVAAAGVGAFVGGEIGDALHINPLATYSSAYLGANLVTKTASAIASAATRSLIEGSDFGDNLIASLPDVIGQTIGNAIAGGISGRGGPVVAEGDADDTSLALDRYVALCQVNANRRSTGFFQAIGDWAGLDGSFGYNGPTYGSLSVNNIGRAFNGAGAAALSDGVDEIVITANRAGRDFSAGWTEFSRYFGAGLRDSDGYGNHLPRNASGLETAGYLTVMIPTGFVRSTAESIGWGLGGLGAEASIARMGAVRGGALVGGMASGGSQMVHERNQLNSPAAWGRIGITTGGGALTGGAGGVFASEFSGGSWAALGSRAFGNATVGAAVGAGQAELNSRFSSGWAYGATDDELLAGTLWGGSFGAAGSATGDLVARGFYRGMGVNEWADPVGRLEAWRLVGATDEMLAQEGLLTFSRLPSVLQQNPSVYGAVLGGSANTGVTVLQPPLDPAAQRGPTR